MPKTKKSNNVDFYYLEKGQAHKENAEKNKIKQREKRIKQNNQKKDKDVFDEDMETVINMTNKNKIKKEIQKQRELDKKEEKRKRRNKKIKLTLEILLIVAIIVGGTVFAFTSPIFNIKQILVENQNQVSAETIISLSGLKCNDNIFNFNKSEIIKKIKENAYIEDVKIQRKLPSTIQINVQERQAKYSVEFMGKYAYANTQGYILDISEESKDLIILQGISTPEDQIAPNSRLNHEDLEKLGDVIKILKAAQENNLDSKITKIDISNEKEYIIYIQEEKKTVHLGDNTNLSNKMIHILALIEQEKNIEGDIFVNGDLNNKFRAYFREKV